MSLANLVLQGDRVHLVTDSGFFDAAGRIQFFHPKSMVFEPQMVAFATVGRITLASIAVQMRKRPDHRSMTQQQLIRFFGDCVRSAYAGPSLDPARDWSRVFVAFYSLEHRRPGALTLWTSPDGGPAEMQPWKYYPAAVALNPWIEPSEVLGDSAQLTGPTFDAKRDMMRLVDKQREPREWGMGLPAGVMVAGEIEMVTLSAEGVSIETLHTYPDQQGHLAGTR